MKLDQIETPALVVDEKAFKANLVSMQKLLEGRTLKLRPHYKSNKCAAIAHMQMACGAIGITCAKLSEAEDLADSGIEDILIANQIVDPDKIVRAALLAKKCRLTVCVDSAENARALSAAAISAGADIRCYVEYDIGMRRCGVETEEEFLELAGLVESLPCLEFAGIQAYAGHVSHMASEAERRSYTEANRRKILHLKEELEAKGFRDLAVSGGSTGTSIIKAEEGLYTELQAGSYIFLAATYGGLEKLPFVNSLYVLATVVSRREGVVILDAGVKSMGMDQGDPRILTMDGRTVTGRIEVNEEHLKLYDPAVEGGPVGLELEPGERVLIIPGHCCSTINLYDKLYMFSDGQVTDRLQITARGCSR